MVPTVPCSALMFQLVGWARNSVFWERPLPAPGLPVTVFGKVLLVERKRPPGLGWGGKGWAQCLHLALAPRPSLCSGVLPFQVSIPSRHPGRAPGTGRGISLAKSWTWSQVPKWLVATYKLPTLPGPFLLVCTAVPGLDCWLSAFLTAANWQKRLYETVFTLIFAIISYFIFFKNVHCDATNWFCDPLTSRSPQFGKCGTGRSHSPHQLPAFRLVANVPEPLSPQD